jgi:hypothetical protein
MNLELYNKVRSVPPEAQKKIGGGRLSGMTDINPMWRIKSLTEQFGMCGFGWKYVIVNQSLETGANGEISAFVIINLYVKQGGEWSEPIPGTGGSSFVAKEKLGLYTSDECFKMALTDAISVACKALGFGADIYFEKDRTKYDQQPQNSPQQTKPVSTANNSPKPQEAAGNDSGANDKATKEQVKAVFASGKIRKEQFPDFEIFKLIDDLATSGKISTKWTYADKEKTKVNWTQQDVLTLMTDLEVPF